MATTQYIGARYVPLFAEPAEWDSTKQYEPLTIVLHEGNSYTSKQYVPVGIEITNEKFWALTGNYNAQVESYRRDVATLGEHVKTNTNNIATNTSNIATNTSNIATNTNAIDTEKTRAETAEQTLQANIDTEKTRAETAEQTLQANIDTEKTRAETAEQTLQNTVNAIAPLDSIPTPDSLKGVTSQGIYEAFNNLINNSEYETSINSEEDFTAALNYALTHFSTTASSFVFNVPNDISLNNNIYVKSPNTIVINGNILGTTNGHLSNITSQGDTYAVEINAQPPASFAVNDYVTITTQTNNPIDGVWKIISLSNNSITIRHTSRVDISNFTSNDIFEITKYSNIKAPTIQADSGTTLYLNNIILIGSDDSSNATRYGICSGNIDSNLTYPASGATIIAKNCCATGFISGFWCGYSSNIILSDCISSNNSQNGFEFDMGGSGCTGWSNKIIASGNLTGVNVTYASNFWCGILWANTNGRGAISSNNSVFSIQKALIDYSNVGLLAYNSGVIDGPYAVQINNCITAEMEERSSGIIINMTYPNKYHDYGISINSNLTERSTRVTINNYICHAQLMFATKEVIPANTVIYTNMPRMLDVKGGAVFIHVSIMDANTGNVITGILNNNKIVTKGQLENNTYYAISVSYISTIQFDSLDV